MFGANQFQGLLRNEPGIVHRSPTKILIQKNVAVMLAIRKIIDDQQLIAIRTQQAFPFSVQSVMVNDDPVCLLRTDHILTITCILRLCDTKPGRMCKRSNCIWLGSRRQHRYSMTFADQQLMEGLRQRPA